MVLTCKYSSYEIFSNQLRYICTNMSQNNKHNTQFGKLGEDIAAEYLTKEKYTVLIRNYRYIKTEIDIICRKDNEIIFVEVKTRSSDMMAYPEKAVGKSKQKNIRLAAENYLEEQNLLLPARFDIIAIVKTDKKFEVEHIIDAFYPFDVL